MANKDISGKLKQARENKGLAQKDVYTRLGVKQSRFSAWENGKSEPEIRVFLELCRIYGIEDIYKYFCAPDTRYNKWAYSTELNLAVTKLRELYSDEENFQRVLNCLNYEYEDYLGKKAERYEFATIAVPVYLQPAAAGLGNYLTDDNVEIMKLAAPPDTDAGIRISGDSMEPDICDGEIVFIKYMPHIAPGDIGIFVYRGEAYCKKLDYIGGKPYLISINPKYMPIPINDNEQIRTVGKVLI